MQFGTELNSETFVQVFYYENMNQIRKKKTHLFCIQIALPCQPGVGNRKMVGLYRNGMQFIRVRTQKSGKNQTLKSDKVKLNNEVQAWLI